MFRREKMRNGECKIDHEIIGDSIGGYDTIIEIENLDTEDGLHRYED